MSVIIKKGTDIPTTLFSRDYYTVEDNQRKMRIDIYEGENIFVKYNHLLAKKTITGLKPRPKGKTKVVVSFEIDINGILTVTAKEEAENNDGQTLKPVKIQNDGIILTEEKMKELEEKNKILLKKIKNNDSFSKIDYSNLKGKLLIYKKAYEESKKKSENRNDSEEEDDKLTYLLNFNETLEDFLDLFNTDKNLDNETIFEKYYLYIRELFSFYIEALKLELDKGERIHIMNKIKEYIDKFINKSSDYLNNLLEIFNKGLNKEEIKEKKGRNKPKQIFYEIVIYVMEKLNESGKECLKGGKKFSKYYSLLYFEQAKFYYEKYLSKVEDAKFPSKELDNKNTQKNTYMEYIEDINKGTIYLCYESFKGGYILTEEIESKMTGGTNKLKLLAVGNIEKYKERCKILLSNYEKILHSIQNSKEEFEKNSKKEAICLANIIYINSSIGNLDDNIRILLRYANRCQFIIDKNKDSEIFKKEQWCIKFTKLYEELKSKEPKYEEFSRIAPEIKKKNKEIFKEIDEKYNKKQTKMDFINFILEKYPYKKNNDDATNVNFEKYSTELAFYLLKKYHPDNYQMTGDENTKLNYCIIHEIMKKLNNLYITS